MSVNVSEAYSALAVICVQPDHFVIITTPLRAIVSMVWGIAAALTAS